MLIPKGFLLVRGIRFTLPFRETITMAASPPRARPVMAAKELSGEHDRDWELAAPPRTGRRRGPGQSFEGILGNR